MIAYLDTCTILNLLQINYDDEYIKYLQKTFEDIKLTPKVFEELNDHKHDNVIDTSLNEVIDSLIHNHIKQHIEWNDYRDSLKFTKIKNIKNFKENGESHSISFSLKDSRFGENDFGEILLKTHFISDDLPAKNEFEHFFSINVIGQILNSIDLMTVFWLKQFISKNELIKYCQSLKLLYCKDINILRIKVAEYKLNFAPEISSKQHILISQLIEILNEIKDDINDRLIEIIGDPLLKDVLNKNKDWNRLLSNIINNNFREKIPYINKRIQDLDSVWSLN